MAAPRHAARPVAFDAPPAGLGYPAPTAYRPHPVTGVPTPPAIPAPARTPAAPRRSARRSAGTRAPLTVAVAGAAMALVGVGSQLPDLVHAVATTAASSPAPAAAPSAPATPVNAPAVARQCAAVVADALDDTVATLGRTPSSQWTGVLDARGDALAATYGETSPEHRAFERGADDILAWMRADTSEDYGAVTMRVARSVAATCGA
ncbi:hypothetical protein ACR9E3_17115 [Actinomycetospora sp. C-140]